MSEKYEGGSAFPVSFDVMTMEGNFYKETINGMSLRDWFAGQALAMLAAKEGLSDDN